MGSNDNLAVKSTPTQKDLKIEQDPAPVTNVKTSRKSSARASISTKKSATKSEDTDSTATERDSAGQQSSLKLNPVQEHEEETSILTDDKNSEEAPKNKTKGATVTSAKKSIEETSTAQSSRKSTAARSSTGTGNKRKLSNPPDSEIHSVVSRKKSKPVIMMTGYESPPDVKLVKELGGVLTNKVSECTVLITDKIRRTSKFLCALGLGIPIVSPNWLVQSKMTKTFLDPWKYLVADKEAEKKWGFSLGTSLVTASKSKLLDGYKVFATSSVLPCPKELKEIVECAGGQYIPKMPLNNDENTFVVSCEADKKVLNKAIKAGIKIQNKEVILTGLLRQKVEFDKHGLVV